MDRARIYRGLAHNYSEKNQVRLNNECGRGTSTLVTHPSCDVLPDADHVPTSSA